MRSAIPVNNRRRDWFRILRDLMAAGVSMSAVARKCCRDVGTVRAWAEGGEPKESDGRTVLAMYALHCPRQYREHQAAYAITVGIAEVIEPGQPLSLPFVRDEDEHCGVT